jgi:hypothetical protein
MSVLDPRGRPLEMALRVLYVPHMSPLPPHFSYRLVSQLLIHYHPIKEPFRTFLLMPSL